MMKQVLEFKLEKLTNLFISLFGHFLNLHFLEKQCISLNLLQAQSSIQMSIMVKPGILFTPQIYFKNSSIINVKD